MYCVRVLLLLLLLCESLTPHSDSLVVVQVDQGEVGELGEVGEGVRGVLVRHSSLHSHRSGLDSALSSLLRNRVSLSCLIISWETDSALLEYYTMYKFTYSLCTYVVHMYIPTRLVLLMVTNFGDFRN